MQHNRDVDFDQKVDAGIKFAIAEAIEAHRRAGRSIVIWRDGKVVTVPADQIPPWSPDDDSGQTSSEADGGAPNESA